MQKTTKDNGPGLLGRAAAGDGGGGGGGDGNGDGNGGGGGDGTIVALICLVLVGGFLLWKRFGRGAYVNTDTDTNADTDADTHTHIFMYNVMCLSSNLS